MFDFAVSTPANTTEADPQRTDMPLVRGVIDQVQVHFPPGPQGLLHAVIYRAGSPLWPRNVGDSFASDDFPIVFSPFYELEAEPLQLTAVTWNEDDSYAHQVNIRFNVVPRDLVFPDRAELGILEQLRRAILGRRT